MKKIILAILFLPMMSFSQDTTKLVNFKMQVRLAACFTALLTGDDDLLYSLRKADKLAGSPALADSITVDTILVTDMVAMYDRFYGYAYYVGDNAAKWLQSHTTAARTQNSYLNSLMTAIETKWNDSFINFRRFGLSRLRRKN